MIQRCLLRQSLPKSSSITLPIRTPYAFAHHNLSSSRTSAPPSRRAIISRSYSATAEATSSSEATAEKVETEPKEKNPLRKELEAKNREIIDLKVCGVGTILIYRADYMVHRINTFAPSPTFAIYKIGPSEILPTPATLPSPDLPKISWNPLTTLTAPSKQSQPIRSARTTAIKNFRISLTG